MLVSPKWQMMWLESQYCSKSIVNWPLSDQQTQKVLEDLKTSCCSPNKAVQLEALRCWEIWINHQSADDWKLNTVCFTGVRPLITRKLQPLHKDVDICKMKLSLMWALLRKVQNIMQLEGPQYILEVFLQSCLTWLSSNNTDGCENEISTLIFQLLLGIFKKNETLEGCDNETFPPLTTDFFHVKKVFHHFVDKFLNIFSHWRIIPDRSVFLKLWKYFLEHCELSYEHIPAPVWHSIFKLTSQICSEKSETIKLRLAFLHSCATSLKSALSSSKFIDFGNLLTTPCEALLKKFMELCRVECDEFYDSEMFLHSKEISEVLLSKSVAFKGLGLCVSVLDVLEEFYLRSLFWGVWCGLVYCYKVQLLGRDKNNFTRVQIIFYRKLRGVAINFELDRDKVYKDCIIEVEKHIDVLNIGCLCAFRSISKTESTKGKISGRNEGESAALGLVRINNENKFSQNLDSTALFKSVFNCSSKELKGLPLAPYSGKFSTVALCSKLHLLPEKTVIVKVDIIKETLKNMDTNIMKLLFNGLVNFRFINLQVSLQNSCNTYLGSSDLSLDSEVGCDYKKKINNSVYCQEAIGSSPVPERKLNKKSTVLISRRDKKTKIDEEVVSVRNTRSRKRAEEEKEKEIERQKRRKRKSFEVLVQEIVKKNKERKTEKNNKQRKNPNILRSKGNSKKIKEKSKKGNETKRKTKEKKPAKAFKRKLKNSKKEEPNKQKIKEKKSYKTDGKLENYFKVISKKSEVKKEEKKPQKKKKIKRNLREIKCCKLEIEKGEKKNETGWKQTSLKTMMSQRNKTVKVKQGLRTRHKAINKINEKQKIKKDERLLDRSLTKFSPFKEIFHDHEYAKLEPEKLQSFEKILLAKKKAVKVVPSKKAKKSKQTVVVELKKPKLLNMETVKSEAKVSEAMDRETQKVEECHLQDNKVHETATELFALSMPQTLSLLGLKKSMHIPEKLKIQEKCNVQEEKEWLDPFKCENKREDFKMELPQKWKEWDCQPISWQESTDEVTENKVTSLRRDRKRMRMLDSLKPSKKIKLEDNFQEEKLPLEITEKENLEEKSELTSPIKKEKIEILTPTNGGSPTKINGRISSRALRMIALVPESTKGGQMQWETSPRVEILKCKKAPNVDKNSRASKMLALLSENVVELEELEDVKMEEVNSNEGVDSKTRKEKKNANNPVSLLKSLRSVKKRKFIRFDDAKNEIILYRTDTPPSQILKEKEKCRNSGNPEIILNLL